MSLFPKKYLTTETRRTESTRFFFAPLALAEIGKNNVALRGEMAVSARKR